MSKRKPPQDWARLIVASIWLLTTLIQSCYEHLLRFLFPPKFR